MTAMNGCGTTPSSTVSSRSGKAQRGEREDTEEGRIQRPRVREPAEVRDHPPVRPLVLDADEEEERSGDEAVVHHLEDRPDPTLLIQHEDAEGDEPHVRDGRV